MKCARLTVLASALALAAGGALGQEGLLELKIGILVPNKTGDVAIPASLYDYVGEGARMGARLAESVIGDVAERELGIRFILLHASAPSVESAVRAANRLIELDKVTAIVGGIGDGQAEAISVIAARAGVPFFNIGSISDDLRGADCNRYMFHIEASESMYVDALAQVSAEMGLKKWYVVHDRTPRNMALVERAKSAIAANGGTVVGTGSTFQGQPDFSRELREATTFDADTIVLLLDTFDQMVILQQQSEQGPRIQSLSLPHALTQTRDFIAAVRHRAPASNPNHRLATWDPTLRDGEGGVFNNSFLSRWGESTDPTAWAAYSAVRILVDTVRATQSTDPDRMIAHLEDPATTFDLFKGPGLSFRPWDHQLRQPIIDVVVDQDAVWERLQVETRIGIARTDGQFPDAAAQAADPVAALDTLGVTASESICRF